MIRELALALTLSLTLGPLSMDQRTAVWIDEERATLEDLRPGMTIHLYILPSGHVYRIEATTKENECRPPP